MKFCVKLLSLSLATLMTLGLVGCSGSDTTWIADYDSQRIPAGVYLFHLIDAYNEGASKVEDMTKSPLKQQVDGVDAVQWMGERAKTYTDEYIAIERKAQELGCAPLKEDNQLYADYMLDSQWEYMGPFYEQNGVARTSAQLVIENTLRRGQVFEAIYGPEGTEPVTEEEILSYYNANFARVEYIALSKRESGVDLEGDALQAVKDEMQGYVDRANAGEPFEDLIQSYRVAHTPEGQEPITGSYDSVVPKTGSSFPTAFVEKLFETEVGLPTTLEDDQYLYLFVRMDLSADEGADLANRRSSILTDLKLEEFNGRVTQWASSLEGVTYNDASLKRYTAKNIKFPDPQQ